MEKKKTSITAVRPDISLERRFLQRAPVYDLQR